MILHIGCAKMFGTTAFKTIESHTEYEKTAAKSRKRPQKCHRFDPHTLLNLPRKQSVGLLLLGLI